MKIIQTVQGSPEWLQHRATTFNASDAPAMLGISPYKTRAAWLKEYQSQDAAPVDSATQRRFDDGHKFEALARPLAEQLLGDDLFPVVASTDRYGLSRPLGASYDGLTMMRTRSFEHKSMNDEIRAAETVSDLPLAIRVQMEQQMMVCPMLEQVLFMATKWRLNDQIGAYELVEHKKFLYDGDAALRAQILEGWKQAETDLLSIPVPTRAPVAAAIGTIPALAVQIRGEVAASNLGDFRESVSSFLAGINTDLNTDDDFATAKKAASYCEESEKAIIAQLDSALAQMASIDELRRGVLGEVEKIRAMRLKLKSLVERREAEIKVEVIEAARKRITDKLAEVASLFGRIPPVYEQPNFQAAIKNKRTLATLKAAADAEAIRICGIIQDVAGKVAMRREWFNQQHADYAHLFADMAQLIYKDTDDFKAAVTLRIQGFKEEQERKAALPQPAVEPPRVMPPTAEPTAVQAIHKNPGRMALIDCIASKWGVSVSVVRDWLREEFGGV